MAIVTKQGEDYEEDLVDEEYDEEGDEYTDSKLTKLFGIPIKFLIIGGAILLLLLIIAVVFAIRGSGDDDVYVPPETSVDQPVDDGTVVTDTPVTDTTGQDMTGTDSQVYLWSDTTGNAVGASTGMADGAEITFGDDVVGVISASGTPIVSDNGIQSFMQPKAVSEFGNNTSTDTEQLDIVIQLRKLGYTGDEISAAQSAGADLQVMIEEARKLRDEEAKEALIRMSDSASEEFRHMAEFSVFSMPYIEFPETEVSYDRVNLTGNYVVNADYWKFDTYGNQLFVKLKIANNTYAFTEIDPVRWAEIPEEGNMVVRIDYTLFGMSNTIVQFYITDITELNVAEVTVNPQDSATDLTDIVDMSSFTSDSESEE